MPTFTGLDVDSQPTQSPQDRSSSHPPPAKRAEGNRRPPAPSTEQDVNTLRCLLFTAEIEKLAQETQKIQAEHRNIQTTKRSKSTAIHHHIFT